MIGARLAILALFSTLLAAYQVVAAERLSCYHCKRHNNENFTEFRHRCGSEKPIDQNSVGHTECAAGENVCVKYSLILRKIDSKTHDEEEGIRYVQRYCGKSQEFGGTSLCTLSVGASMSAERCVCDSKLCNKATVLAAVPLNLFIAVLARLCC